ncbi:AAA family ATPase [Mesorhizobium sp. M0833]|uniref:nSTAND1 domain-containing NTPase n=1 Tax=Mesorhizobium sp. M0833 TaxID=2957009 RepID=UPI0033361724
MTAKPYPGLRSFTQEEASLFFGREVQVRQLRDILADRNLVVVLGGSGSGKSSLVRAGLLPKLNSTAPIPKRSGAWYPIEFRPRANPAEELFEAIFSQVFQPLLKAPSVPAGSATKSGGEDQAATATAIGAERLRRLEAVSAALNISPALQPGEDVEAPCKEKLRELLFSDQTFDVGSLFEFAEQSIVTLDERLATGPRSGKANLLILIDQFEEVFSLPAETKEDGLSMVMALVTSIQAYRPANLFLIVTMRNEWLHRCSEIPGVAEAMNGSTYLVDLIANSEIRNIIVEPARWVLRAANLHPGPPACGPFADETLCQLQAAFDDVAAVEYESDRLPLLQHLLPLLWAEAAAEHDGSVEKAPFSIEPRHLCAVPGWNSKRKLAGCLNANAGRVLDTAVAVASKSARIGPDDAGQLMHAALTNLAVLDDQGIVRRRFATIDKMLDSSAVAERQGEERDIIKEALTKGLAEFVTATLIDSKKTADSEQFDINHEALVRNWETYAAWVDQVRSLKNRLRVIDDKIRSAQADRERALPLTRLNDLLSATDLRSAAELVGSETAKLLDDVFGSRATFSQSWAYGALDGDVNEARNNDRVADVARIKNRVEDAQRFRNNPWHQYRFPLIILIVAIVSAGAIGYNNYRGKVQQTALLVEKQKLLLEKEQLLVNVETTFDLQRLASAENVTETDKMYKLQALRSKVEDFVAFSLVSKKSKDYQKLPVVLRQPLADTLTELDERWRSLLGSKIWLRRSMTGSIGPLNFQDAICIDPGTKSMLPILNDAVAWVPVLEAEKQLWRPALVQRAGEKIAIASNQQVGEDWQPESVVCTSPDGKWQFTWMVKDINGKPTAQTPRIRNIVINRLPVTAQWPRIRPPTSGNMRLYVSVGSDRWFDDYDSLTIYRDRMFDEFGKVSAAVRDEKRPRPNPIRFARDGHWVGFQISSVSGDPFILWTTEGVSERQEDAPRAVKGCVKQTDVSSCVIGPMEYAGEQYEVLITSNRQLDYFPQCEEKGAICNISVQIRFAEEGRRQNVRAQLGMFPSTQIKGGIITSDGYLILADDGGQFWRYLFDGKELAKLQKDTWRGENLDGIDWRSSPCEKLRCKDLIGSIAP